MENRNGLIVDTELTQATGWAERAAAEAMIETTAADGGATLGSDKSYDAAGHAVLLVLRRSAIDGRTTRHPGYAQRTSFALKSWPRASAV